MVLRAVSQISSVSSSYGPSSLMLDPRNYGSKCSGWYGLNSTSIDVAGTGFAVGDKFMVVDNALDALLRGATAATGHVTSIGANGSVTGYAIDTVGSGYTIGAAFVTPLTGVGVGFAITISSVFTGPSAPMTTLASGGNATASWNGSYVPGSAYQVGDLFAVPNPSANGNYLIGRVSAVSAGVVTSYTINNFGGDYQILNAVPTITLTGYGAGLTINITSATNAGSTFDDTYGVVAAAVAAVKIGASVLIPDNLWVQSLMLPGGVTLRGQNLSPNYSYGDDPNNITPSAKPHMFLIGDPNFCIDLNNQGDQAFEGFEIRAYNTGAYGSSAAIGSYIGNGGGNGKTWLRNMSFKGFYCGFGNTGGTGSYIYAISENCDYGANQYGVYGPMSDFLSVDDTFASGTSGMIFTGSAGGFFRVTNPRFEYLNDCGIQIGSGGSQIDLIGAQFDRIVNCGIRAASSNLINVTGGAMKGCGLAGTLTVTGTANNGSGLIRLTVSGFGSNPQGGSSATSGLVTGDIANISGVVGTTEANANQWTITVIDGSHIDLQGSTYVNSYVSGGLVGVNGKSSYIVLNGVTDFHSSNVGYYGSSAGSLLAPASVIDSTGSSRISITGGSANIGNGSTGGYRQAFANWHNSANTPPANFTMDITGQPRFSNEGTALDGQVTILNAVNGTITFDSSAPYPYTINGIAGLVTSAGTVTVEIAIAGTAVTGLSAISASTSPSSITATGANTVGAGQTVTIILSSASSLGNVAFQLTRTRNS